MTLSSPRNVGAVDDVELGEENMTSSAACRLWSVSSMSRSIAHAHNHVIIIIIVFVFVHRDNHPNITATAAFSNVYFPNLPASTTSAPKIGQTDVVTRYSTEIVAQYRWWTTWFTVAILNLMRTVACGMYCVCRRLKNDNNLCWNVDLIGRGLLGCSNLL